MSLSSQQTTQLNSGIQLGTVANLLYGYQPTWDPTDPNALPFFPPANQMLNTSEPVITEDSGAAWGNPTITLCASAEDLITALYDYAVVPGSDEKTAPTIPSGPLVLDDQDRAQALQTLKQKLGVDLSDSSLSYALVQVTREVGSATHPSFTETGVFTGLREPAVSIKSEHRLAIPRRLRISQTASEEKMTGRLAVGLPTDPDPTPDDIQSYFNFFQTYGTHFVSKIHAGDVIYQVFAYGAQAFAAIQKAYTKSPGRLSGPLAVNFDYYTTKSNGAYGYVAQYGNILNLSGDPALGASVANGDWQDSQYADGPSIFQAFQSSFPYELNDKFTQVVTIGFELRSISMFSDVRPRKVWRRIFNAAMYQKYGNGIQPVFENPPTYNFSAIFPETGTGFVSTISTPTIDVYKDLIDLSQVQMVAKDIVQSFTVVSNVMQASNGTDPIVIPGTNVTLVSHVFDMGSTGNIPTLQLTDTAYGSYQIACQDFRGVLVMTNASGTERSVIADGQRYKLTTDGAPGGRFGVVPDVDVRQPPSSSVLEQIEDDIDFSLTTAEAILNARNTSSASEGRILMLKYLNWIAKSVPDDTTDESLLQLQVRAFYLARVDAKLKFEGISVPYLTYETYKPLVGSILTVVGTVNDAIRDQQQQIAQRKEEELVINVGTQLNQNIIQTGKLLTGYINANAQQSQDLANYYGSVITQQQNQMTQAQATIAKLTKLLSDQQQSVNQAVIKYQDAVTDWENQQILNFSLGLAQNIFTLGFAVVTPSTTISALKDLGQTAQMIQKAINIFKALNDMYQTLQSNIKNLKQAQQALSSVGYDGATMPSSLQWSELSVNFQAALNNGPAIPEKNDLSAAFSILVLRGQALLTAQGNIQQIAGQIYSNQQQQNLAQAQQQRLGALTTMLNTTPVSQLDPSQVDLLGLTSSMQFVQKQMLAMLAKALVIQDVALQYEYLQSPTSIPSFDLLSLEQIMLAQQQNIIAGLSVQPPPEQLPNAVTYTVRGISTSDITNGNAYKFTIPVSAKEFFNYAMIRVLKVIASVDGIKSTGSGQYVLDLVFSGDPFDDRDSQRNLLTFNTIAREFDYLYDADTGAAQFGTGTGTWGSSISDITPFSQWQVSLPQNQVNTDLVFDSNTIDLTLSFTVEALLRVPSTFAQGQLRAAIDSNKAEAITTDSVAATTQPTVNDVVTKMNSVGTVLRGWDVVFNLTEDKINTLLAQLYTQKQGDQTYFLIIPDTTTKIGPNPQTGNTQVYEWSLTLGTPSIKFLENNTSDVQIFMDIIAGTYKYGIETSGGQYIPVVPETTINTSAVPPPSIQGNVPLAKVQGDVTKKNPSTNIYSVVLDMSQGAFTANNLTVATGDPNVNVFITNYFTTKPISLLINQLDLTNWSGLAALTPTQFLLNTLTTDSGLNILQMFITTTGQQLSNLGINLNDPIPQGYDLSLMINTAILFGDIFVESFKSSSGFGVAAVQPAAGPESTAAWSARMSAGSITGDFPATDEVRIGSDSNTVTLNMAGMTFTGAALTGLTASYNNTFDQSFQYYYCTQGICGSGTCNWDDATLPLTVTMNFPMSINVVGTGSDQSVQIQSSIPATSINGTLDSSGPCSCNNRDAQEAFLNALQTQLPGPLSNAVNVTFSSVSLFALKNLLFQGSYLQMMQAFSPGDLVVFGDINTSS
jgi:hypothetical protein